MKQAINKYREPALRQLVARAQAQPEATRVVVLREVATLRRLGVKPVGVWSKFSLSSSLPRREPGPAMDSHLQFHILQEKKIMH